MFDDLPLRDFPDRAIRELLLHPEHLRSVLRQVVPAHAERFDCERREPLDREFPLDDWRRRQSDLLFLVPYRADAGEMWTLVCVLIEHQSAADDGNGELPAPEHQVPERQGPHLVRDPPCP